MRRTTYEHERTAYYKTLFQTLKIILDKEIIELKKGKKTWIINNWDIQYEHADDILTIYTNTQEIAKKEAMLDVLWILVRGETSQDEIYDNYHIWYTSVCFFWLCKIGFIDEAIGNLNKATNPLTIINPLKEIIETKTSYFDSNDLWVILNVLKKIKDTFKWDFELVNQLTLIIEDIINIRYNDLKRRLNSFNIEINSDKKQVIEYLKRFWFEDKYNITLNKLDKFIANEEFDETVIPWWIIWILREFFKDFYIDLAKKIINLNGLTEIPHNTGPTTEIGHAVNYIWREFGLSSDEKTLLKWYTEITNNNGAHSLLSEKKYFRLARNIWIEISLFMLSKFEDYKNNKIADSD